MKIGILWGAGLGDLLVLRPFVMMSKAVYAADECQVYLLSTANHLPELYREILGDINFVQLSTSAGELLGQLKSLVKYFDVLYLGPYPTLKTRLLAFLLCPREIWVGKHRLAQQFILEQVVEDLRRFDVGNNYKQIEFPYAPLPWRMNSSGVMAKRPGKPYLIMHLGAKGKWKTTRWSIDKWVEFVCRLVKETNYEVCFIGTRSEQLMVDKLVDGVRLKTGVVVQKCLSLPLADVANLISCCSGVVCHNSGILHLATILKKRTLAITGSSAVYWQPPYEWVCNISSNECLFHCNQYSCPIPGYRAKCIRKLSVQTVWDEFVSHILSKQDN